MTSRPSNLSKFVLDPLVGLVLTALLLAGLEASLWGLGLGNSKPSSNRSRGFDPAAAYIVPSPETEGAWETRFSSRGRPEIKIPPRSNKVRIFTYGGSNTAGFPIGVMQNRLARYEPQFSYEAINLGRQGYGSARVRLIFEQSLEKLDPDVVVIYAGHNEFIEKGFKMDLEEAALGSWSDLPNELASKTRLYQAAFDHYSKSYVKPQTKPEAWKSEYEKFANITYDETLTFFDAYEENIRSMCQTARDQGVEVILCTIVYCRLAVPFSSTLPRTLSAQQVEEFTTLFDAGRALFPSYLRMLLWNSEQQRLQNQDWGPNGVGFNVGEEVLESTQPSSGILAGRLPMLETEETWTPKVRQLDRCLKSFFEHSYGDRTREDLEQAESLLAQALKLCPDHPEALFDMGIAKKLLERDPAVVVDFFERAATFDRAPRKGSEAINNIIRKVAKEVPGVVLYDIDKVFKECHPDRLIGYEWMVDYCHLNFGARWVVMEMLSDRIYELWPPAHFKN